MIAKLVAWVFRDIGPRFDHVGATLESPALVELVPAEGVIREGDGLDYIEAEAEALAHEKAKAEALAHDTITAELAALDAAVADFDLQFALLLGEFEASVRLELVSC